MLGAVKKKKRKKGAIEFLHYRGMNVPRIEDRGLTNSKLDFHSPHLRDLKIPCNSILFFMYQYIIILSKKKKRKNHSFQVFKYAIFLSIPPETLGLNFNF